MELAHPGKEFITARGEKIRSIIELRYALEVMDPAIFNQHVTPQKNDFATWIRDVFDRADLVKAVQQAQTREGIIAALKTVTEQGRSVEEMSLEKQKSADDIFVESETLKERIRSLKKSADDVRRVDEHESYYTRITQAQQRFKALRERITLLRKEGRDMFIPELMTRSIKVKFQYLDYAQSEDDLAKCGQLIDQLEHEIADAAKEPIINVAQEIKDRLIEDKTKSI